MRQSHGDVLEMDLCQQHAPVLISWLLIILPQLALGKSDVLFSEFQAVRDRRLYLFGLIFPRKMKKLVAPPGVWSLLVSAVLVVGTLHAA